MQPVIRNIFTQFEAKKTEFTPDMPKAKQEFKKQCDINEIVKQARRNGEELLQPVSIISDIAIDLSQMPPYAVMVQKTIEAQQAFEELDPKIRRRFNDDPAKLLEFLQDPANKPEAQKLGLVNQDPEPIIEQKLDSPKV